MDDECFVGNLVHPQQQVILYALIPEDHLDLQVKI